MPCHDASSPLTGIPRDAQRTAAIQPCGFLIATSADWIVTHVSANADAFLNPASATTLIGHRLDEMFCAQALHDMRSQMQTGSVAGNGTRIFALDLQDNRVCFDVTIHACGESVLIDCEPSPKEPAARASLLLGGMIERLQKANDMEALLRLAAREMRGLTGFDRVMICRGAWSGGGTVVAESARAGLPSFIGESLVAETHEAPASLRFIADIDAPACAMIGDDAGQPLDVTASALCAATPAQATQLRERGAAAHCTLPIRNDGHPWGSFVCHHAQPHLVCASRRMSAGLFALVLSPFLALRERDASHARP